MRTTNTVTLNRRAFLSSTAAGAALLGMPSLARAQSSVTLRAAHIESTNSATHKGYEAFAKKVGEATDGQVEVKIFPAGQLGNLRDLYEGIQLGSVDITSSGPDYTSNIAPIMVVAALYYSYRNQAHADSLLDGEFSEKLSEALASQAKMRILAWGELGWRSVFSKDGPVTNLDQFSGLKIRVGEAQLHILPMRALGASPTPIPYSDVYTSLQTGIVDAAEGTPAVVIQQKFDEVTKHYSLTRHLYNPIHLVIGSRPFDGLTSQQQDAVSKAAREAFQAQRQTARDDNAKALKTLRDGGMDVHEVDAAPLREAVKPTWAQLTEGLGQQGQDLMDMLVR